MTATDWVLALVGAPALLVLAGWEVWAIANRTPGDTYTERMRAWFRTDTRAGAYGFLIALGAAVGALVVWLGAHVVQIPV